MLISFLPRDTVHARFLPRACVCLCLSVTSRCFTKTAKYEIIQTISLDSAGTLVFWRQRPPRNSTGINHCGGAKCRWGGLKSAKFSPQQSSVYRWYPQLVRGRFVYDTYTTMEATRSRHGWVHMFITRYPTVNLQLDNFNLFRTCRPSIVSALLCGNWQDFNWHDASRGSSEIAELLVTCAVDWVDLYVRFWAHVKIASRIVLYRTYFVFRSNPPCYT